MALTAEQAYFTWQGSPYQQDLARYITVTPGYADSEGEGAPATYQWNGATGEADFLGYLQNQQNMQAMAAKNPDGASMLVDYEKFKDDPSAVTAQLLRRQYDDYLSRFAPVEQTMYDLTTYRNPGLVGQEIQKAIGTDGYVSRGLNSMADQQQRSAARLGLSLTAEQRAALDTGNNLARSTAAVDAANNIRRSLAARNDQIMIGATPNSGRSYSLRTDE
jgi:hypothetical protein